MPTSVRHVTSPTPGPGLLPGRGRVVVGSAGLGASSLCSEASPVLCQLPMVISSESTGVRGMEIILVPRNPLCQIALLALKIGTVKAQSMISYSLVNITDIYEMEGAILE